MCLFLSKLLNHETISAHFGRCFSVVVPRQLGNWVRDGGTIALAGTVRRSNRRTLNLDSTHKINGMSV